MHMIKIPFDRSYTSSLIYPFSQFMFPSKPRECWACKTNNIDDNHYDKKYINYLTKRRHREVYPLECKTHDNTPVCACVCSIKKGFKHKRFEWEKEIG